MQHYQSKVLGRFVPVNINVAGIRGTLPMDIKSAPNQIMPRKDQTCTAMKVHPTKNARPLPTTRRAYPVAYPFKSSTTTINYFSAIT